MAWILVLGGLLLLLLALWLRQRSGLPWARVVAADMDAARSLQRPLFSRRYLLTGKPDYILQLHGQMIPVEVKPGRHAPAPYQSDLMQLAAYCLLLEEETGRPPPYGLLRYAKTTFRLTYTPAVRDQVLAIVAEMQATLDAADCARSHSEPRRCAACGFRDICDEALV